MENCGCKGARTCALCSTATNDETQLPTATFIFCYHCHIAFDGASHQCQKPRKSNEFRFGGVSVFEDFVTAEEEDFLVQSMSRDPWALSQSGRLKQDFGAKVNFKRQRVKVGCFTGLPAYSCFLVNRINQIIPLHSDLRQTSFQPVELCNLQYCPERGACIVPHFDDFWLWGPRLITLNLLSSTILTFTLPPSQSESKSELERINAEADLSLEDASDVAIRVPLPRRSLVIVDGSARYTWLHSIRASDIIAKRIAMTFRELSSAFLPSGDKEILTTEECMGKQLLELAGTYQGAICNV